MNPGSLSSFSLSSFSLMNLGMFLSIVPFSFSIVLMNC